MRLKLITTIILITIILVLGILYLRSTGFVVKDVKKPTYKQPSYSEAEKVNITKGVLMLININISAS